MSYRVRCIFAFLFVCFLFSYGQDTLLFVTLTPQELEKFILEFPAINAELEIHDIEFNTITHEFGIAEGVDFITELDMIVKNNGYSGYSGFIKTLVSVEAAYTLSKNTNEEFISEAEMNKSLIEIENNQTYTNDQKEIMMKAIRQSYSEIDSCPSSISNNVLIIQPYMEQLDKIFDK